MSEFLCLTINAVDWLKQSWCWLPWNKQPRGAVRRLGEASFMITNLHRLPVATFSKVSCLLRMFFFGGLLRMPSANVAPANCYSKSLSGLPFVYVRQGFSQTKRANCTTKRTRRHQTDVMTKGTQMCFPANAEQVMQYVPRMKQHIQIFFSVLMFVLHGVTKTAYTR